MKNQNRLSQFKEILYYLLGILLISGFVYRRHLSRKSNTTGGTG
jgi:hypothetical protein